MRILVTGGAGFIGSHLVDRFLARGDQVTVLDDFSTGLRRNLPAHHDRLRVIDGTICDPTTIESAVADVELVFHFAAAVGVGLVRERPLQALQTNVMGVVAVLAAAARHAVPIVLASSSEVYGRTATPPFHEDSPLRLDDPRALRTSYASAKAHAECAAFAHAAESGLRVLVVRLFNTVGPRQRARYGMVLPRFVAQAQSGHALSVFGDGEQTRCFAHVEDVVTSIERLVAGDRFGQIFNVGSDRECTILELADSVLRATNGRSRVEMVPFESAHPGFGRDIPRRVPDLTKLREAIGVVPHREIDEIVREVVRALPADRLSELAAN